MLNWPVCFNNLSLGMKQFEKCYPEFSDLEVTVSKVGSEI